MKLYRRGVKVWLQLFLISALDGKQWLYSRPGRFNSTNRSPIRIGPRVCVYVIEKSPYWDANPDRPARSAVAYRRLPASPFYVVYNVSRISIRWISDLIDSSELLVKWHIHKQCSYPFDSGVPHSAYCYRLCLPSQLIQTTQPSFVNFRLYDAHFGTWAGIAQSI